MAHQHYRTKAIFLKKEDRGEADQIFAVFSEDFGKLEVLGRAIRKITSKLRSGAEVFYFSEIEFIQGKNYKTLTDAILIDKFKNLRSKPEKLEIAFQIADALDALTSNEERDDKIWQLLHRTFQSLTRSSRQGQTSPVLSSSFKRSDLGCLTSTYFLWNLFSLLGYKPELYKCPSCQKKLLPETLFFVPQEGGVVCWQCLAKIKKDRETEKINQEIAVDTVKILRLFLSSPLDIVEKLRIAETDKKNLKQISEFYLAYLKENR